MCSARLCDFETVLLHEFWAYAVFIFKNTENHIKIMCTVEIFR